MHFHRKRHTACDISVLEEDNTRHVVVKALLDDKFDVKCCEKNESLKNKFYHEKARWTKNRKDKEQRAMINEFFWPKTQDIGVADSSFQQDGATCHIAGDTIVLLKGKIHEQITSRNGPVNWPPRSCDLAPLDYFSLGYMKSLVYFDRPQSIDALEANITRIIKEVPSPLR